MDAIGFCVDGASAAILSLDVAVGTARAPDLDRDPISSLDAERLDAGLPAALEFEAKD